MLRTKRWVAPLAMVVGAAHAQMSGPDPTGKKSKLKFHAFALGQFHRKVAACRVMRYDRVTTRFVRWTISASAT